MEADSANFRFLRARSAQMFALAALAERYFSTDPPSSLSKLRLFAELMAKDVAARHALLPPGNANFDDLLRTLRTRAVLPREIAELFFHLKRVGNAAIHEHAGTP